MKPNTIQCSRCAKYFPDDHEGALHQTRCCVHAGFTNYETWAMALWMDNDEGSYRYWRKVASECRNEADSERSAAQLLADRLKEEHEAAAETRLEGRVDVFNDLVSAALSEVSWLELADN